MTEPISEVSSIKAIEKLLAYYNFQDELQTREQLLDRWLRSYPVDWVRLALIEALYQGRYKSASVEYLLQLWQRRGQPLKRFSREFERLVSHNCPKTFLSLLQAPPSIPQSQQKSQTTLTGLMDKSPSISRKKASIAPPAISPQIDLLEQEDHQEVSATENSRSLHSSTQHESAAEEQQKRPVTNFPLEESPDEWGIHAAEPSKICRKASRLSSANPIHSFTPISRPSGLYEKLAAMANTEG